MKNIFSYLRHSKKIILFGVTVMLVGVALLIWTYAVHVPRSSVASFVDEKPDTPMMDSTTMSPSDPTKDDKMSESTVSNPVSASPPVTATTNGPSSHQSPSPVRSNPSPVIAPTQSFGVNYVSLSQPVVYCSGGGDYYIAQIGDVVVGVAGGTGGEVSYGFEVSGGIPDTWNGYRQKTTIPAGVYSTSFNKLYWGDTNTPHLAYSETIWSGHGAASIRAVVYAPNLTYSPWLNVPAQGSGEKCM